MKLNDYEQQHLDLVIPSAAECTLFLKENGAFPLEAACSIAAYGDGVRHTVKGGTGSGEVNSRFSVNIEQGLRDAGFTITTGAWLDAFDGIKTEAHKAFIARLRQEAKRAHTNAIIYGMGKAEPAPEFELPLDGSGDAAIYVVARNSGEGNDRKPEKGDVKLTDSEVRDILACQEKYAKFMLVLNVGGPVDLSPVYEQVDNILVLSQLGVVTGTVLADILLGRQNPSGKLATTWSRWEDYSTVGSFGDPDDVYYREGVYVGYRYFDSVGKKPLFPFGYGLSYTRFAVRPAGISVCGTVVTVQASVNNTGKCAGKDAVQVYVSSPAGKIDKPYQALAAFAKTGEIPAGGSETVSLSFDLKELATYDTAAAAYVLEAGNYIVRVGDSSADTAVAGVLALDGDATVLKAKNCLGDPGFEDWKPEKPVRQMIDADTKVIAISSADIAAETVAYDPEYPVDDVIKTLSEEELVYMNIGGFNPKAGVANVIGEASSHVAGAAGESTSVCAAKGIKPMIMADGPAGLRLAKEYFTDGTGAHTVGGGGMPESMIELMGGVVGFVMRLMGGSKKPPKGVEIKNQYATAIPIGTAIAQSFNYELAKALGDIVGDEMERFGVHLWLAPALNIHRSILCGRNFEYYSEDPLVSGMMAAAITEGVQAHPGCGTTIKHYAANNAELNRYCSNSRVSERAMREIYLKGFGICVRKAQPHALMTSYNLLNGTHTSEHRGLCEDVLRCEYGYKGIVMTDWVIAMLGGKGKYRGASAAEVPNAGGDLFMPGSKGDYKKLLAAVKAGTVTRKQLEINATRVKRMADKLVK